MQEDNSLNEKNTNKNCRSNFLQRPGHFLELQAAPKKSTK